MDHLGFLGFVDLGGTLPLALQCMDSQGQPTAPTGTPSYSVYSPSFGSALTSDSMSSSDTDSKTGFRTGSLSVTAANGFGAGELCTIRYSYVASGLTRVAVGTFQVV